MATEASNDKRSSRRAAWNVLNWRRGLDWLGEMLGNWPTALMLCASDDLPAVEYWLALEHHLDDGVL
jgi:hypothetical protein